MLGISDGLALDLVRFQEFWESIAGFGVAVDEVDEANWAELHDEGWQLVDCLGNELGPRCEVTWVGAERKASPS